MLLPHGSWHPTGGRARPPLGVIGILRAVDDRPTGDGDLPGGIADEGVGVEASHGQVKGDVHLVPGLPETVDAAIAVSHGALDGFAVQVDAQSRCVLGDADRQGEASAVVQGIGGASLPGIIGGQGDAPVQGVAFAADEEVAVHRAVILAPQVFPQGREQPRQIRRTARAGMPRGSPGQDMLIPGHDAGHAGVHRQRIDVEEALSVQLHAGQCGVEQLQLHQVGETGIAR